ncbi:MAG TPA: DUF362 domain-containing protein [Phycisphaerae bacterium]|nr:DUF362 domain-containing protein [Phycisphaerae bacterium]HOB76194.1 DUF362 domain-containing protein [Phycisphaerae bacterium]HOJ53898.1 DUF362 domain-containing protein [Phycisphaerae bacterium]HOL27510.1 DUF362 domain-containing protein [Phycisphaerae bacterium]HPP21706.1 DUF362 domain-containing protein [Phycisphaerae bacterium]
MANNERSERELSASSGVTRREMLIRGGATVALAGAAAIGAKLLYDPVGDAGLQPPPAIQLKDYFGKIKAEYPASAPRISTAFGRPEYLESPDKIAQMVRAAIGGLDEKGGSLGIRRFISRGDTVCIKPNVGFDRGPALGATTNPDVVRAVIRLCREAGAKRIIVADNPIEDPAACFAKSGIKAAAEAEGAEVVIHADAHDAPVQVRPGSPDPARHEALGTWPIFWKPLKEADKVIGIPPIKDHNLCFASMGMKNWYGLLGGRRNQFHQAIHNIISDLGFMMKPTLIVADGTRVMMKNGPTGGRMEDIRIGGVAGAPAIVASVDQLACDSYCLQKLLGRDPANLQYLQFAWDKFGGDASRIVARHWQEYHGPGLVVEANV